MHTPGVMWGVAMLRTIFLDAGGVILDESGFEEAKAGIIAEVVGRRRPYTPDDYWLDAEEGVQRFVSSVYEYVLYKNLDRAEFETALREFRLAWKARREPYVLMPGLADMLDRLSARYEFGILGQYGDDMLGFLRATGVLDRFAFMATQDSFGLTKPDTRYFLAVLGRAGRIPSECLMVGDRIDKDVYPANVVGMRTVRLRTGLHRNQEPRIPVEEPDVDLESLDGLTLGLLDRLDASEGKGRLADPASWKV